MRTPRPIGVRTNRTAGKVSTKCLRDQWPRTSRPADIVPADSSPADDRPQLSQTPPRISPRATHWARRSERRKPIEGCSRRPRNPRLMFQAKTKRLDGDVCAHRSRMPCAGSRKAPAAGAPHLRGGASRRCRTLLQVAPNVGARQPGTEENANARLPQVTETR